MSTILDNSILNDVKKLSGLAVEDSELGTEDYTPFDTDLLLFINALFNRLKQLGVGPTTDFSISSSDETWGDFFGDLKTVAMARAWMVLSVRLQFDPPASSIVVDSYKNMIDKYEWCMNVDVESEW